MFKVKKDHIVHIYTIAYNEERLIQFFIDHYRKRFPNCPITVYDNMSDDRTVEICKENNCEVITYDTGGKLSDATYLEIKNNCWKNNQDFKWALVCDVDELLDINIDQLLHGQFNGVTGFRGEGYNMVTMFDDQKLEDIDHGFRAEAYDKLYLFDTENFSEINYFPGCHNCSPVGYVKVSDYRPKTYHYKFLSEDYMVDRYRLFNSRMSDDNIKYGWGKHYNTPEDEIRINFRNARNGAIKVKD